MFVMQYILGVSWQEVTSTIHDVIEIDRTIYNPAHVKNLEPENVASSGQQKYSWINGRAGE